MSTGGSSISWRRAGAIIVVILAAVAVGFGAGRYADPDGPSPDAPSDTVPPTPLVSSEGYEGPEIAVAAVRAIADARFDDAVRYLDDERLDAASLERVMRAQFTLPASTVSFLEGCKSGEGTFFVPFVIPVGDTVLPGHVVMASRDAERISWIGRDDRFVCGYTLRRGDMGTGPWQTLRPRQRPAG